MTMEFIPYRPIELDDMPLETATLKEVAQYVPGEVLVDVAREMFDEFHDRIVRLRNGDEAIQFVKADPYTSGNFEGTAPHENGTRTAHTTIVRDRDERDPSQEAITISTNFHDQYQGGEMVFKVRASDVTNCDIEMHAYKAGRHYIEKVIDTDEKDGLVLSLIDDLSRSVANYSHGDDETSRRALRRYPSNLVQ